MNTTIRRPLIVVATTEFSGGAELYIARLASEINSRGGDCSLVGSLPTWADTVGSHMSIGAGPKWGTRTLFGGLLRLRGERRALRAALLNLPSDAVFNLHFKREQIAYSRILAQHGTVVWTEHGRFPTGLFGRLIRFPYRLASRWARSIICVSDVVERDIARVLGDSRLLRTVDSGIDLDHFSPLDAGDRDYLRRKWGVRDGHSLAVFVGRLEPSKRVPLAIQAAAAAQIDLLIAGAGHQESIVRSAAADSAGVHYVGEINGVNEVFAMADVHLFMSDGAGEGFPTVLLEASACGLPSVVIRGVGFEAEAEAAGGIAAESNAVAVAEAALRIASEAPSRRTAARAWAETRGYDDFLTRYAQAAFSSDQSSAEGIV